MFLALLGFLLPLAEGFGVREEKDPFVFVTRKIDTQPATNDAPGLKEGPQEIVCTLLIRDIQVLDGPSVSDVVCQPESGAAGLYGLAYELVGVNADFLEQNEEVLGTGRAQVKINGGIVSNGGSSQASTRSADAQAPAVLLMPTIDVQGMELEIVPEVAATSRSEGLVRTKGYRSLLVIRVTSSDQDTLSSKEILSNRWFGGNGDVGNLKEQYQSCSHNQLNFEMAVGSHIVNGVAEISITIPSSEATLKQLQNAVTAAAPAVVGDLSQWDHVAYCMPKNSDRGVAYAYTSSWLSVFNDAWCDFPSVQIHELGHNLGFKHSGETDGYDDQTGYMGYSYPGHTAPLMCFNAAKSWQSGWYEEHHDTFDPLTSASWSGKLVGPTDYDQLNKGEHMVVLRVMRTDDDDLYLMFNRREGFNIGTQEGKDEVIVNTYSGSGTSRLVAKMGSSQTFSTTFDSTGEILLIEVTSIVFADDSPDYASVTVSVPSKTISSNFKRGSSFIYHPDDGLTLLDLGIETVLVEPAGVAGDVQITILTENEDIVSVPLPKCSDSDLQMSLDSTNFVNCGYLDEERCQLAFKLSNGTTVIAKTLCPVTCNVCVPDFCGTVLDPRREDRTQNSQFSRSDMDSSLYSGRGWRPKAEAVPGEVFTELDLKTVQDLAGLVTRGVSFYSITKFKVQISSDRNTWEDVADIDGNLEFTSTDPVTKPGAHVMIYNQFQNVENARYSARYVRVWPIDSTSTWSFDRFRLRLALCAA